MKRALLANVCQICGAPYCRKQYKSTAKTINEAVELGATVYYNEPEEYSAAHEYCLSRLIAWITWRKSQNDRTPS